MISQRYLEAKREFTYCIREGHMIVFHLPYMTYLPYLRYLPTYLRDAKKCRLDAKKELSKAPVDSAKK